MNPLHHLHHPDKTKQPKSTEPTTIHTTNWRNHANCKGNTNAMFPTQHKDITYITTARNICRNCPVKPQCLDYALTFPPADMSGVWAGLTPRQLAAEQRRRGITPTKPTIANLWNNLHRNP